VEVRLGLGVETLCGRLWFDCDGNPKREHRGSTLLVAGRGIQSIKSGTRVQDSLKPFEFRPNHSERSIATGHVSQRINVDVCDRQTVTQNKIYSFLYGSSLPKCLRYRLGLIAVDPKLGEKKWRLQNA